MRIYICLFVLLAGCATAVTPRTSPPKVEFTSQRSIDDAVSCVTTFMSANNAWKYPFLGQIKSPGQSYEVHPSRQIMTGGEPIFLTLDKSGKATIVKGYAVRDFGKNFAGLKEACA